MPQIFLFEPFQMVSVYHGLQWFHGLWRPPSFSMLQDTSQPSLPFSGVLHLWVFLKVTQALYFQPHW